MNLNLPANAAQQIGSSTTDFIGSIAPVSELAIGITMALMIIGAVIGMLGSSARIGHMDHSGERFAGDDDLF